MSDINKLIKDNPFEFGLVFTGISIILIIITIYRRESLKLKDHSIPSWKAYMSQLSIIFMLFVYGILLLFRSK